MGNTKSLQQSTTKSAYSVGASMVSSNSGLSWFDHPVNRENKNIVVNLLSDLKIPIIAVWLVARPIDRQISGAFEHWVVKIQARGCLISIDFLESSGKGAFGMQQRSDIGAELEDFMYYGVKNRETGKKTRHKWEIISSVTPHPLRDHSYLSYLSDHDRLKLEEYMKNAKMAPKDPSKFLKDIRCGKRICDIAEFCSFFSADNKGYNPITKNCQQFAAELFRYLVGDYYRDEVKRVFERYQSPYDKQQWKNAKITVAKHAKLIQKRKKIRKNKNRKNRKNKNNQISIERNSRKRRSEQTEQFIY